MRIRLPPDGWLNGSGDSPSLGHISSAAWSAHDAIREPRITRAALARSALRWVLLLIIGLGLLLRLAAAWHYPLNFDESESLLAVRGVAAHGVPIFPSGVLFVHGATLSYLLAPLVWLGRGELDDLFVLRAVSAVFGAAAVYLTYRLAQAVVGSSVPALLAAALVALDPLSVEWGTLLRMYALEQALVVAVAWLFIRQVVPGAGTAARIGQRQELVGLVVTFWLAVFAHLGAALLWPAMAAAAVLLQGRALLGPRRALSAALGLCLPAPLVLVVASTVWEATGTAPSSTTGAAPSFVGDQHVDLGRVLAPDLGTWTGLFHGVALAGVMPTLVAALSGLLVGRWLLVGSRDGGCTRRSIAAVLLLYWVPVLAFAAVAVYAHTRYLLFLQPLGAVLVAAALTALAGRWGWATRSERALPLVRAGAVVLALLLLTDLGGGLLASQMRELKGSPARRPDPTPAYRYVAAHHTRKPIVVGWPPAAYLVLGDRADLRFLVEEEWRLERYTRLVGDKRLVDEFVGAEVVASVADLCRLLAAHRGTWLVADRFTGVGAMPEGTEWDVVAGAAKEVFRTDGGVPVFRSVARANWTGAALTLCTRYIGEAPGAEAQDPVEGGDIGAIASTWVLTSGSAAVPSG